MFCYRRHRQIVPVMVFLMLLLVSNFSIAGVTDWTQINEIQSKTNGEVWVQLKFAENINNCSAHGAGVNAWLVLAANTQSIGRNNIISGAYSALLANREVKIFSSVCSSFNYNEIDALNVK